MLVTVFLAAFLLCVLLVYLYAEWLRRNSVFEIPNARSSHKEPVPSGGGLPVMAVVLGAIVLVHGVPEPHMAWPMLWAAVLALVSWADDRRPLSPLLRFALHVVSVATCLAIMPVEQRILLAGAPLLLDRLVAGLCWVWFINLYNFMDGIDGLAGSETVMIALGVLLIATTLGAYPELLTLAAALAGSAAGFLVWNWQRAKVFFGDSGSIPTGFLIGWMLVQLAAHGAPVAAVILPLYFLADATITLFRRILRGDAFWRPHREHFYQLAVRAGLAHQAVVLRVIVANAVLLGAAMMAASRPVFALAAAAAAVTVLIGSLWLAWRRSEAASG